MICNQELVLPYPSSSNGFFSPAGVALVWLGLLFGERVRRHFVDLDCVIWQLMRNQETGREKKLPLACCLSYQGSGTSRKAPRHFRRSDNTIQREAIMDR